MEPESPEALVAIRVQPRASLERVLGLREDDVCFSAAKLFFAYGLGNALSFPMSVGATTILMPERPTPEATFKRWLGGIGGVRPTVFYGAPTGFAGMLANPALPPADAVVACVPLGSQPMAAATFGFLASKSLG